MVKSRKAKKIKYPPTRWIQKKVAPKKKTVERAMKGVVCKHKRIVKKNKKYYGYCLTYKNL
jgi:hypothetical protein